MHETKKMKFENLGLLEETGIKYPLIFKFTNKKNMDLSFLEKIE